MPKPFNEQESPTWTEANDLSPTLNRIRRFTMVPQDSLVDLARMVRASLAFAIQGDFVECGVWRGGSSFLMADLLRQEGARTRKVWLFDSFQGLPPPAEVDGPAARMYAEDTQSAAYYDNCRASFEEVQGAARELGLERYTELVKGWFDQTLPAHRERIGRIAVLRIDGDWYASVRACLENLYDQVADGGFIILDDYYAFDGCRVATHEFLARRNLAHALESVGGGVEDVQCAIFRKGGGTWKSLQQLLLAREEIAATIPRDVAIILLDEQWFGTQVVEDRRTVPLVEREGENWGPPEDDSAAIRELERQRESGAGFIVFGWPAFWYLEYYPGLEQHLRRRYRCALQNERLLIFDLRSRAA